MKNNNNTAARAIIRRLVLLLHPSFMAYYFGLGLATYVLSKATDGDGQLVFGICVIADIIIGLLILAHVVTDKEPEPDEFGDYCNIFSGPFPYVVFAVGVISLMVIIATHFML